MLNAKFDLQYTRMVYLMYARRTCNASKQWHLVTLQLYTARHDQHGHAVDDIDNGYTELAHPHNTQLFGLCTRHNHTCCMAFRASGHEPQSHGLGSQGNAGSNPFRRSLQ